jgi:hypothetical protein
MVALALDRAPTASLPLRYLRMVPVWGLVAAVLLWQQGANLFASRWAPGTVALTHAFTLGVLGNAMLGSLLQFLPVVAGIRPRAVGPLGALLPVLFNSGLAGLVCGLLHWPALIPIAGVILASAITLYCVLVLIGLRFDGQQILLRSGIAVALLAVLAAALVGLMLALGFSGVIAVPMLPLTDAHAAIGLLGGVLMLCGSVGSVVVPMFQGTATLASSSLISWIAALLGALTLAVALRLMDAIDGDGMAMILALPVAAFAVAVLVMQWRAPHRRNRALVGFWRLGAFALLAATAAALVASHWMDSRATLLAGVLGIGIALPALVLGMLLEIAAFLAWLDLHHLRPRRMRVPGIDTLLPESRKLQLLALHWVSALALPVAVVWPIAATVRLAALALGASYGVTLLELLGLRQRIQRFAKIVHRLPRETT